MQSWLLILEMPGFLTALVRESVLGAEGAFGMVNSLLYPQEASWHTHGWANGLAGGLPPLGLALPPSGSHLHQGEHRGR